MNAKLLRAYAELAVSVAGGIGALVLGYLVGSEAGMVPGLFTTGVILLGLVVINETNGTPIKQSEEIPCSTKKSNSSIQP